MRMRILTLTLALLAGACSTAPKPSEAERALGAQVEYLRQLLDSERARHAEAEAKQAEYLQRVKTSAQVAEPEQPTSNIITPQVCVSEPIFDSYGRYVRTTVRCN